MRKQFVSALVLIAATGSASADWVPVSYEEGATVYFDSTTIRRNRNLVKMWEMKDYARTNPGKIGTDFIFLSQAMRFEYDCLEYNVRLHDTSFYSEPMGKGKLLHTESFSPPSQWVSVAPGSTGMLLLKKACETK